MGFWGYKTLTQHLTIKRGIHFSQGHTTWQCSVNELFPTPSTTLHNKTVDLKIINTSILSHLPHKKETTMSDQVFFVKYPRNPTPKAIHKFFNFTFFFSSFLRCTLCVTYSGYQALEWKSKNKIFVVAGADFNHL